MATIQQPNEEQNSPQQPTVGPSTTTAPVQSAQPQAQRQGSGRFTNLQKYMQANQQAGQNLVSNVSNKVQGQIDTQKNKADESSTALQQGIAQGRQGINQGQAYQSQLKDIGQNIQNQTSTDQNKNFANRNLANLGIDNFDNTNYQAWQSGQGVDETRLGLQQQMFANNARGLAQAANQAGQSIGTDSGRFQLIKNTFGGNNNPNYSLGQQKLDQMFLAQNPLTDLRRNINTASRTGQQLLGQASQTGQDVSRLGQTERDIIGQNLGLSRANTDAFINMLGSYTGELNAQRGAEWDTLGNQLASLKTKDINVGLQKATPGQAGQQGSRMDAATLARLGVTSGPQQVFNTFNELKGAGDVAIKGRDAANYQDVATQADVDKYAALSRIAQIDPSRLTQASQLGAAWDAKTGADSLQSRINTARDNFNRFADTKNYTQHQQPGRKSWAESQSNLRDILEGKNIVQADRKMAGALTNQANEIYKNALRDLQSQGYGNVLNADTAEMINAISGVKGTNAVYDPTQGRISSNGVSFRSPFGRTSNNPNDPRNLANYRNAAAQQLLRSQPNINFHSSDLDEQLAAALSSAGIKNKDNKAF